MNTQNNKKKKLIMSQHLQAPNIDDLCKEIKTSCKNKNNYKIGKIDEDSKKLKYEFSAKKKLNYNKIEMLKKQNNIS